MRLLVSYSRSTWSTFDSNESDSNRSRLMTLKIWNKILEIDSNLVINSKDAIKRLKIHHFCINYLMSVKTIRYTQKKHKIELSKTSFELVLVSRATRIELDSRNKQVNPRLPQTRLDSTRQHPCLSIIPGTLYLHLYVSFINICTMNYLD